MVQVGKGKFSPSFQLLPPGAKEHQLLTEGRQTMVYCPKLLVSVADN